MMYLVCTVLPDHLTLCRHFGNTEKWVYGYLWQNLAKLTAEEGTTVPSTLNFFLNLALSYGEGQWAGMCRLVTHTPGELM